VIAFVDAIRLGHVHDTDAREAVRQFHAAVYQPGMALVLFFCSSSYDLEQLADEMRLQFADTQVVGCTTAGELGPDGIGDQGLTGVSFSSSQFTAVSDCFGPLKAFDLERGRLFVTDLERRLNAAAADNQTNTFSWLMTDGLSVREELVAWTFQNSLVGTPLVGGSAGDDLRFESTRVFHKGCFHTDSAVLVMAKTAYPVKSFMTQHFVPTERRFVITDAEPEKRLVREIDGLPAAQVYAELIGVDPENLDPMRFAATPMVVTIGDVPYVRAISHVLPDGSLKLFCAIEEGVVLRLARGEGMLERMQQQFTTLRRELGEPLVILGCDCVLRRIEMNDKHLIAPMGAIMKRNRVVGFNSYGEQYGGVHVNQTFTGLAIGKGLDVHERFNR
jgi:hypothetical protein